MPACPLLTLRRPPHEGPTHNSGSWLIAIHYHMEDLHLLLFAGFYRRFRGVPLGFSFSCGTTLHLPLDHLQ
jgi:hypothetical protein